MMIKRLPAWLLTPHFTIGMFVLLLYAAWYACVWPGPWGPDGYSLILNINAATPEWTGKDPAWLLYALTTYGTTHRVEALVIPLLIVHVLVFTRIVAYIYNRGGKKIAIFLLFFIACAPHILNGATSLYSDSIFSIAFIGVLFECWLILNNKEARLSNLFILLFLFPMAGFFKGNGIIILLPVLYTALQLRAISRFVIILAVASWCIIIFAGGKAANLNGSSHGIIKPLILFETTNFMQSKPMKLHDNRHMVTDKTKEVMYRYISQEDIDTYFDRDYWDTLWHQNFDRIKLRQMSSQDYRSLRTEFFKYNLWRNLPAFMSSRVNIFLASAFAQGGIVAPTNAQHGLKVVPTKSIYNPFHLEKGVQFTDDAFNISYDWRFLLWSPFLGITLLFLCIKRAWCVQDRASLVICFTLFMQLSGIFFFSIAAEYRYLLIFFFAPLLLFPMIRFPHGTAATDTHHRGALP